jgi:hypothetical protein
VVGVPEDVGDRGLLITPLREEHDDLPILPRPTEDEWASS